MFTRLKPDKDYSFKQYGFTAYYRTVRSGWLRWLFNAVLPLPVHMSVFIDEERVLCEECFKALSNDIAKRHQAVVTSIDYGLKGQITHFGVVVPFKRFKPQSLAEHVKFRIRNCEHVSLAS